MQLLNFDILDFENVVPKPLLEFYIDKGDILADRRSIESMYTALAKKDPSIIQGIYSSYKYGGSTAVNIFEEITLPPNFLTKKRFERVLKEILGEEEIYNKEFRPSLSNDPQIHYIEDRGNSIVITFVVKGNARRVRDGYEVKTYYPINFEYAIVRFMGPTLIELRCSYNMHGKFLQCFENYFRIMDENYKKHKFNWVPITKVTNKEAEEVARILSAGLVEADHKDDGIYDRHIVTASPKVRDLRQHDEYVKQFKNKMLLSQTLITSFEEKTPFGSFSREIKFKINLNTGFQFLSKVSEGVIDYVMGVFIAIRYKGEYQAIDEEMKQRTYQNVST